MFIQVFIGAIRNLFFKLYKTLLQLSLEYSKETNNYEKNSFRFRLRTEPIVRDIGNVQRKKLNLQRLIKKFNYVYSSFYRY
jgi:hypothetical protein